MRFATSITQYRKNPYFIIFGVLVFTLPLLFSSQTREMYEFPKTHFLHIVTIILLAIFVTEKIIKNEKFRTVPKPFYYLSFSFLLSSLVSSDFSTSLRGYYSRFNDSLLSTGCYLVIFYVAASSFNKNDIKALLKIANFGSVLIFILGISQYFPMLSFLWGGEVQERVFSTLGQPNWLAQYLLILISLNFYSFIFEKDNSSIVFYLLQFTTFWLSFSLSGLLGFLVLVVFSFVYMIVRKKYELRRFGIILAFAVIIGALFPGLFLEKLQDTIVDINKIVSSSLVVYAEGEESAGNLVSDTGYIRFGLWDGTLRLIFSSPKIFLVGTGPETFPYSFQLFRPGSLNYSSEWNYVFNKPHNYFLEIWAEQGLIGLVSFFWIGVFLFKKLDWRYKFVLPPFIVTCFFGWLTVPVCILLTVISASAVVKDE